MCFSNISTSPTGSPRIHPCSSSAINCKRICCMGGSKTVWINDALMSVALWMMCMSNLVDINDAEKPSARFLSGGANPTPGDFLFLPHREGLTCNTKRSRRSKTHTQIVRSHLRSFPLSDRHDMTFIWALQNRSPHSALHVSNSPFAAGNGCLKNSNLSSQKPCEVKRSQHDQDYHLESVGALTDGGEIV